VLKEIAPDTTIEQLQAVTEPKLIIPPGGPAKMPVAAQ
jgi:hypothetical protein